MDEHKGKHITNNIFAIPSLILSNGKKIVFKEDSYVIKSSEKCIIKEIINRYSICDTFFIFDYDQYMKKDNKLNKQIINDIISHNDVFVFGLINTVSEGLSYLNKGANKIVFNNNNNIPFNILNDLLPKERRIDLFNINKSNINNLDSYELVSNHVIIQFEEDELVESIMNILKMINKKNYSFHISIISPRINSPQMISQIITMNFSIIIITPLSFGIIYTSVIDYYTLRLYQISSIPTIIPLLIVKDLIYPLGITFTTKELLIESIEKRICIFYSRDRKAKWVKGESSGNYHFINNIYIGCNRCFVMINVTGNRFCHLNYDSCFHYKKCIKEINDVYDITPVSTGKDIISNLLSKCNQLNDINDLGDILQDIMRYLSNKSITIQNIIKNIDLKAKQIKNHKSFKGYYSNIYPTSKKERENNNLIKICICLNNYNKQFQSCQNYFLNLRNKQNITINNVPTYSDLITLIKNNQINCVVVYQDFIIQYKNILSFYKFKEYFIEPLSKLNSIPYTVYSKFQRLDSCTFYKIITTNYILAQKWLLNIRTIKGNIMEIKENNCISYLVEGLFDIAICQNEEYLNNNNIYIIKKNVDSLSIKVFIKEENIFDN